MYINSDSAPCITQMLPHFVSVLTMAFFSPGQRDDPVLPPLDPVALSDLAAREMRLDPVALSDVAVREPRVQLPGPRRINGFGPSVRNEEKYAQGIRQTEQLKCTDPSHSDRVGWFRTKSQCRLCLKEEVERIPLTATRWQVARYLSVLFRSYFCPFCFLQLERAELHTTFTKKQCLNHRNLNRTYKCKHEKMWQYCTQCMHDPRSGSDYCLCGAKTSGCNNWAACKCSEDVKGLSYGLRFGTNPFVVPTDAGRQQEDLWAAESLALASLLELSGVEVERKTKKARVAA